MGIEGKPSFADVVCDLEIRKVKSQFFQQVDTLLDWKEIGKIIDSHYKKGQGRLEIRAMTGCSFLGCLLQTWYGLSGYEVEDWVNGSISFSRFCGLTLEQPAPDHSRLLGLHLSILVNISSIYKLMKY